MGLEEHEALHRTALDRQTNAFIKIMIGDLPSKSGDMAHRRSPHTDDQARDGDARLGLGFVSARAATRRVLRGFNAGCRAAG
jgi:hypothetical protein